MALIKCPECGKEVSTEASVCPHCGYPLHQKQEKVIEAEVVSDNEKFTEGGEPKEIKRYREEIGICAARRRAMVSTGIVLTVLSFIALIVFSVLYSVEIVREATSSSTEPGRIVGAALAYMALIIVFAITLEGGVTIIVIGSVVNSVKIKKRLNRIRQYELRK